MQISLALSPTNPALSKGVRYEPEAVALFSRFSTPPTASRKAVINTLIKSLKDAGIWSKLDCLWVMAAADSQASKLNWIADQYNLTAVASPTFTSDRGYSGDGVGAYLATGFTPSTNAVKLTLNSGHYGTYRRTGTSQNPVLSVSGAGSSALLVPKNGAGNLQTRVNQTTTLQYPDGSTMLGDFVGSRENSANEVAYLNGAVKSAQAIASSALETRAITLLRANTQYSSDQISAASIGAGLSSTEILARYTAIAAYLTSIGA